MRAPQPGGIFIHSVRAAMLRIMLGFLNACKPPGPTSHDIVAQVRRRVPPGVKVGHCGTLDPFAEGVLVLAVGRATRLARYVQDQPKRYMAEVMLGATSTTDDPQGRITPAPGAAEPNEQAVRQAVGSFVGEIMQAPPAHSAVHVDGHRAYELARRGRQVDLPPRRVVVHEIRIVRYAFPKLELDVRCGSGTYIRALARDIGVKLGTGGYCSALKRTEVGPFAVEKAVEPEQIDPARHLLSPLMALTALPKITVDEHQARLLAFGKFLRVCSQPGSGKVAVVDPQGRLLAIAWINPVDELLRPHTVLRDPQTPGS